MSSTGLPEDVRGRRKQLRQVTIDILTEKEEVAKAPVQFNDLKRGVAEVLHRQLGAASGVLTAAGHPELPPEDSELLREVYYDLRRDGGIIDGYNEANPTFPFFKALPDRLREVEETEPVRLRVGTEEMQYPVEITESLKRFQEDHPDPNSVAFIIMQFGGTPAHNRILQGIQAGLEPVGIAGLRADDKEYHSDLFYNVLTYVYGCGFGIAVFERIEEEQFNPNVSLEVGYMYALGKPVCLLKDRTLKTLHSDIIGKLYRLFDPQDPVGTIPPELAKWIADKDIGQTQEYLKRDYGKLEQDTVYMRRGSSTDPTKPVTPQEIAQMGMAANASSPEAELAVEFADPEREIVLGPRIPWSADLCGMPGMDEIPSLSHPRRIHSLGIDLSALEGITGDVLNAQFYREVANYEFFTRLFRRVRIVVTNKGKVAAINVRVELFIPKGKQIGILDRTEVPELPKRRHSRFRVVESSLKNIRPAIRHAGDVDIDADDDRFKLEIECKDLQPGRKVWSDDFYIGIGESGEFTLQGYSYAANLSEPKAFTLTIDADITETSMTVNDLIDLAEPNHDDEDIDEEEED